MKGTFLPSLLATDCVRCLDFVPAASWYSGMGIIDCRYVLLILSPAIHSSQDKAHARGVQTVSKE